MDNGKDRSKEWAENADELASNLHGAKLKFGNTTRDSHDPRICRPHSRVVPPARRTDSPGGLLQTGGHRPGADSVSGSGSGSNFGALRGPADEKAKDKKDS